MNENSKGNSNRNPEQSRLDALFQERERLTWEAHRKSQEPTPAAIKDRQKAHRAEVLRRFIKKTYPNETKTEQEVHLRRLLGLPEQQKQHISKPVSSAVPARKNAPITIIKDGKLVPRAYEVLCRDVGPDVARMLFSRYEGKQIQYR